MHEVPGAISNLTYAFLMGEHGEIECGQLHPSTFSETHQQLIREVYRVQAQVLNKSQHEQIVVVNGLVDRLYLFLATTEIHKTLHKFSHNHAIKASTRIVILSNSLYHYINYFLIH